MNEELETKINSALDMSVNLGSLGLTLGQILALRPGTTIEFSKPDYFEVLLKLGDVNWLEGEMYLGGESVRVNVTKICACAAEKSSNFTQQFPETRE